VFLAGTRRKAMPHATFMYHGVGFGITTAVRFKEKNLRERLDAVRADQAKMASIIIDRTQLTQAEVENLFLERDAGFAWSKGIIHEVDGGRHSQ
jgi:ATP-dependent protease ClpP protease subunit